MDDKLSAMAKVIRQSACPDIQIGPRCDYPYTCPLHDHCWSFLPEQNVTTLYRGGRKCWKLLEDGIVGLGKIPQDCPLTKNQEIQGRAVITGQALNSPDRSLQLWAVSHFGSPESTETQQNPWVLLLPKLERLAVEADATIRSLAHERLKDYPAAHDFITRRVELETSPDVLMRDREPLDQLNQRFVQRLCFLLNHPDERVRHDALLFVGFNHSRAPMWDLACLISSTGMT